ncbi:prepilin-type N-terminal cleavage/methylation domain-containing protein [Persephonella sp.]
MKQTQRGFTLVELAIVLVIIGIILGAVLKGQDLINNARMKKLTTAVKGWEVSLWTCYDRLGAFPGDDDRDGVIDDSNPLDSTCIQNLAQRPSNTVNLGSYTFYIYPGHDGNNRNVLVVCASSDCNTAVDTTQLDFLQNLDTSIDGVSNGTAGVVRAVSSVTVDNTNNIVTDLTLDTGGWNTTNTKAAVYYFDKAP